MSEQQESRTDIDTQTDAQRANTLDDAKQVEFYSQAYAAWFSSALEHSKGLLALSVGGIGFLASIMSNAAGSLLTLLLYMGAITSFVICVLAVLMVFDKNQKQISHVLSENQKEANANKCLLQQLDKITAYSFSLAVLLSATLAFTSAISTYHEKGEKMTPKNLTSLTKEPLPKK